MRGAFHDYYDNEELLGHRVFRAFRMNNFFATFTLSFQFSLFCEKEKKWPRIDG